MISVIVYGRNDAHGYNLHRRVALSLNCIAEVLSDADDEIVFVDYNTPDELPTLIESLGDTLTDRCLDRTRVLRVRAALHENRFAARTHLSVVEPVARNAAVRRANPANRWLLSTNTDMVFLSLTGASLSEICAELPDGFYSMPRFELPEWLWEALPRSDPRRALTEIARLGPTLHLDEPTISHEWIRYDAPGDFQLFLRNDFVAIDGFNEEMVLGYHVDSNFSRRMLLHRGAIDSVGDHLAGYHCNHNRTPTVYHGVRRVTNDLERFFFDVEHAELEEQRSAWGLADATLEDVPIRERLGTDAAHVVAEVVAERPRGVTSDAFGAPFALTYDSGHVLPFIADSIVLSPRGTTFGYIGVNSVLAPMIGQLVERIGSAPLVLAEPDDPDSVRRVAQIADAIVVDLGIDASLVDGPLDVASGDSAVAVEVRLGRALDALGELVEIERVRLGRGEHPRRIVLVNSASEYWKTYVLTQLDCSYTTAHSRVRRATVKPRPGELPAVQVHEVLSPLEASVINIYRRRPAFKALVDSLIGVGALVTRASRLGRTHRRLVDEDADG